MQALSPQYLREFRIQVCFNQSIFHFFEFCRLILLTLKGVFVLYQKILMGYFMEYCRFYIIKPIQVKRYIKGLHCSGVVRGASTPETNPLKPEGYCWNFFRLADSGIVFLNSLPIDCVFFCG